jgi:two-component system, NtrC family, response regulator PilR
MVANSSSNSAPNSSPNNRQNNTQILVVDDEPDLRTLYELTLLREGFRVEAAGSVKEAWQFLSERHFDVVITDMRLPDGLGLELLQRIKADQRTERCVVITAYGSAENAVESLKAGAFDYLTKPVDLKQFRTVIASAVLDINQALKDAEAAAGLAAISTQGVAPVVVEREGARRAAGSNGRSAMPSGEVALARLVGDSAAMCAVRERIAKVARSMAPVLVRGESGTGKELAAMALHANSHRASGALIAVNCSAIPENLLESEFFGAKKGAFTGAAQDRIGFFQAASGGTLFLDEIGDLPLAMQSKLLRAIQERSVRPVGATQEEPVNVRIVSATHRDLASDVQAGRFRQDLYYRLNVIEIVIPPLRERLGDLPALCEALLKRIALEAGIAVPGLSTQMLEQLALEPLRGNVRELENLLHRAVALSEGNELQVDRVHKSTWPAPLLDDAGPDTEPDTLPTPLVSRRIGLLGPAPSLENGLPADLQDHLDQHERQILVKALQESGYNRTAAATRLGLSLRQIRYRIARLNIDISPGPDAHDEPG